ncbi:MAG: 23S rRNA (uracil(1939)-C(5))-methyltransferase RlmD, partial [Coriobacteriales bacterium]|nr:23S rRNA (uracil(1939)-C(5))-methyltransferase RlmD [Coriobacteriales bacterium]
MGYKTYTCPLAKRCGGCELLAVPYELQLKRKQAAMEELFHTIVAADAAELRPIAGMQEPRAYRHKAASPYAPGPRPKRADKSKGKGKRTRMRCGFYERGTHTIAFCKDCLVEAPGARKILVDVAHVADDLGIPAYQEDQGKGVLRHAVVRCGYATGEVLLTVVTNGERLPHAAEFVARLCKRNPQITSIVQNVNDRRTNAILGTKNRTLAGPGIMHDRLLGCTFEIGPTSFYQTNPEQTEALYQLAIEGIGEATSLLDAYCGTGTIGICAAAQAREAGRELKVIGVEQVSGAVGCARRNARANDLAESCRFTCADATEWMAQQERASFDAVILDPPRAGSTPEFLKGVARLAPQHVVYVSCNPTTQVRDLALLRENGYRLESI